MVMLHVYAVFLAVYDGSLCWLEAVLSMLAGLLFWLVMLDIQASFPCWQCSLVMLSGYAAYDGWLSWLSILAVILSECASCLC
jgi:hypothetical protein